MNPELLRVEPASSLASVRDRVLMLRSQPMLEGLDDEGLLLLAEHGHLRRYRDGEVIAEAGAPAKSVYLVTHGTIVVSRAGTWLTTRHASDAYGALPLLAREPSPLAIAGGETHTLELAASAFESALVENFSLLRNMLRQLGNSVLQIRGNLPMAPTETRTIDRGVYYEQPRSLVEQLIQLRESPFGRMNLDALVDLARSMAEVRYPAGEHLWSAGQSSTHALHVDAGSLRCIGPDGRQVSVGRGFTVGVMDVWAGLRAYDVQAEVPVIAFRIEFENFLTLLEKHPEVGLDLLRGFARDLLMIQDQR